MSRPTRPPERRRPRRCAATYARRHGWAGSASTAAVLAALLCAAPFLWSVITAFKQNRDLYNPDNNPFLFNQPATLDHVLYLFDRHRVRRPSSGTRCGSGVLVVAITLVLGLPAAYALARLDRPWAGLDRHRDLLRLPGAADPAVPVAVADRGRRSACRTRPGRSW